MQELIINIRRRNHVDSLHYSGVTLWHDDEIYGSKVFITPWCYVSSLGNVFMKTTLRCKDKNKGRFHKLKHNMKDLNLIMVVLSCLPRWLVKKESVKNNVDVMHISFINSNVTKPFYRKKKLLCTAQLGMATILLQKYFVWQAVMWTLKIKKGKRHFWQLQLEVTMILWNVWQSMAVTLMQLTRLVMDELVLFCKKLLVKVLSSIELFLLKCLHRLFGHCKTWFIIKGWLSKPELLLISMNWND